MATAASTSAQADDHAKTAVLNAVQAQAKAGPYHTTGTIVIENVSSNLTTDVVPPDRIHYTMNTPDGPFEYIGIGSVRRYMKIKGVWHTSPLAGNSILQSA